MDVDFICIGAGNTRDLVYYTNRTESINRDIGEEVVKITFYSKEEQGGGAGGHHTVYITGKNGITVPLFVYHDNIIMG